MLTPLTQLGRPRGTSATGLVVVPANDLGLSTVARATTGLAVVLLSATALGCAGSFSKGWTASTLIVSPRGAEELTAGAEQAATEAGLRVDVVVAEPHVPLEDELQRFCKRYPYHQILALQPVGPGQQEIEIAQGRGGQKSRDSTVATREFKTPCPVLELTVHGGEHSFALGYAATQGVLQHIK